MWTRSWSDSADRVREGLKRQVTAPVRWEQAMRVLRGQNVDCFIEVGPGKVLSGLLRQIDPQAECLRIEDRATLNEVLAQFRALDSVSPGSSPKGNNFISRR